MTKTETLDEYGRRQNTLESTLTWWTVGLIALLIPLAWFVYAGWFRIYLPDLGTSWAVIAAFGMAVLSWVLAWAIGRFKGHELAGPNAEQLPRALTWTFIGLLIFISAWGTANTLLLLGESTVIYRETLDRVSMNLSQLRATADSVLATPEYDKLKGRVENSWASARRQLTTVAYCGEGSYFRGLLKPVELQLGMSESTLFGLGGSALRYSGEQCQKPEVKQAIALRAREYDDLIHEKLLQSDAAVREKVADRSALKSELQREVDKALAELTAGQNALRTGVTRSEVLQRLTDANSVFVRYRSALAEVSKDQVKNLPENLDLKMANGLGSISQSFGIFVSRFGDVWVYVAVAIGFDFLIAWVAYRRGKEQLALKKLQTSVAAARHAEIERAKELEEQRIRQNQAKETYRVKHLWVPAMTNSTTSI
jgi:hypothetical protein